MGVERFIWTDHAELRLGQRGLTYDREADIAWFPTGDSADVVSEEVGWGLIDHDSTMDQVVAIEVWSASKRLPPEVLATLPARAKAHGAAA